MLVDDRIEIKWNKHNRKNLEEKGYVFTNYGDSIIINTDDLSDGSHENVVVKCDYCNKEYELSYKNYIKTIKKYGNIACKDCVGARCAEITLKRRQDELYNQLLYKCEEFDYELLSEKSDIKNNRTYIKYLCKKHGEKTIKIANLISGKGCQDCAIDNVRTLCQLSPDDVYDRIKSFGGILLNKNDYKNRTEKNLQVLCPECNTTFTTSLVLFTQHNGQVCDNCQTRESMGEKKIRHYLEANQIVFKQYYWFCDCRDINPLPFDFYLPENNVIIEFDGRQHFEDTGYFSYSFEQTKKHDEMKNNYCKTNGIYLIRIPYWDIDKIDKILDKELILHEDIV